MDNLWRTCFFCAGAIEGKKTLEHVIPDKLLGKMGIKEVTVTGDRVTQYSRIKVPAHGSCNSGFGARYEDRVLDLLKDTDALYEVIRSEEGSISMIYGACESVSAIITTWLSKIYYGMFYDDLLKSKNSEWKEICAEIVGSSNFEFVKKSYKHGHGFQLPSSLYAFKTADESFDLVTIVQPGTILLKVKSIALILCICDGLLTKNYLFGETLGRLRSFLEENESINPGFPVHKFALAEILSVRSCIPKTPKFIYGDHQVINMSLATLASNPEEAYQLDIDFLKQLREMYCSEFGIRLNP